MACAHCAISSSFFLPSSSSTIHSRRKTQTLAALSLPSPSNKLTTKKRRKNYLRPKLLKTLTKPYISYPILPQQTTEKREENFSETLEIEQRSVGDVLGGAGLEGGSNEEKEVVLEQNVGISDVPEALVGRLALEVIGYSALQTICIYCVLGVVGLIRKSRDGRIRKPDLGVLGSGIENGKEKGVLGSGSGKENGVWGSKMENGKENGVFVNVDNSQIEEKIGEIRVMAREARESEGLTKKVNGVGSSSDVVGVNGNKTVPKIAVSKDKASIEKEVDWRLKMFEKEFGSIWNKSIRSLRRDLRNSSKVKDHPKGFQGRKDNGLSKGSNTAAQDASLKINGDVIDVRDLSVREKQEGTHSSNGCIQETSNDVVDSKKSSKSRAKISRSFKEEARRKPKFSKLGDKRADSMPDLWWMKLPYVLAIFLRRGPDPEASKGLYSLKMDGGSSSYTVAFENRSDAKNFCYIMESRFAELGGFSAEVVPMAVKEIESLKSSTKKILVLRKGQLHLYAGQTLMDVEMALRAILG